LNSRWKTPRIILPTAQLASSRTRYIPRIEILRNSARYVFNAGRSPPIPKPAIILNVRNISGVDATPPKKENEVKIKEKITQEFFRPKVSEIRPEDTAPAIIPKKVELAMTAENTFESFQYATISFMVREVTITPAATSAQPIEEMIRRKSRFFLETFC